MQLDGTITHFANNRIGTDATGSAAARQRDRRAAARSTEITIGGNTAAARNVISDNVDRRPGGRQRRPRHDRRQLHRRRRSGSTALGNTSSGISVEAGATGVTIGGVLSAAEQGTTACDGACNVVSGGAGAGDTGIEVAATADGVTVLGNAIGTRADGTLPSPATRSQTRPASTSRAGRDDRRRRRGRGHAGRDAT